MFGSVDITYFCNDLLSVGDPLEFCVDQTQHPFVRRYRGGSFAGVSMHSVINIGCSKYSLRRNEVPVGSKIGIAMNGSQLVIPIRGEAGEYIRPKKDGTWKVGCKRKNAVGQILECFGNRSIVRLM